MSPQEQEAYLDGIRRRRLATVEAYKKQSAIKQQAKDERLAAQLEKQCAMIEKEIAALDKALDKVEKRAAQITALNLLIQHGV